MTKSFRLTIRFTLAFLAMALLPVSAHAACTLPDGEEGMQVYDSSAKIMKYCDGDNWVSMKSSNVVAITGAKISTGTVASGGFPTSWSFASGTDAPDVYDGVTTTASGSGFQNEVCAVRFGFAAQVTSMTLHADDGGDGIDIRRAYSLNGTDWTVIDTSSAYSATVGTAFPMNNVVAKYVGISTTDATNSCDEITVIAVQTDGGSAGLVQDDDSDTQIQVEESPDEDRIRFDTDGNQRAVITETGEVGIGTDTPASLLDVAGGVRIGDDAGVCNAAKEGTLRFSSSMIQLCTQNVWVDMSLVSAGQDVEQTEPIYTNRLGLPEVIMCVGSSQTRFFYFDQESFTSDRFEYRTKAGNDYVYYNLDKTFSFTNFTSDCNGKDIDTIIADNQGFDFDSGVESSMVSGWPDRIECTYSSLQNLYFLDYIDATKHYYYDSDGKYHRFDTATQTEDNRSHTTDCNSQTIADLTTANRTFNYVGGDGTKSHIENVPDAIFCTNTSGNQYLLFLTYIYSTYYRYETHVDGEHMEYYVSGGTLKSDGLTSQDCGRPLAEIVDAGLGVNYNNDGVTSTPVVAGNDLIDGWPDLIVCENGPTNYVLRNAYGSNNTHYYYSYDTSHYMTFDQTTLAYTGQDSGVAGTNCNGLGIADLITGGMTRSLKNSANPEASAISGWPDVIECPYSTNGVYYYHYGYSDGSSTYYYWQPHSSSSHRLTFNTGTQNWASNQHTTECSGRSIPQLTSDGRTYNILGGNDTGSMMTRFPDAIQCRVNNNYWTVFHLGYNVFGSQVQYFSSNGNYVYFEPETGAYDNNSGGGDCANKSIAQLNAEGRAHYFVDTGNAELIRDGYTSGVTSMVEGYPDAIVCNSGVNANPYIYWLQYVTTSSVRYKNQIYSTTRDYIQFYANGRYHTYDGGVINNTDCFQRSIQELREYGQTFDLVSGSGGAGASIMDDNDGDTRIQLEAFADEDQIRMTTRGTERLIITEVGRVGIGTTTPSTALDVAGAIRIADDSAVCDSTMDGALRYNSNILQICVDGSGWGSVGLGKFEDGTNVLDAVYTAGNVGIGTVNPTEMLEVDGTTKTASVLFVPVSGAAPTTGNAAVAQSGGVQSLTTSQRDAIATPANGMLIFNTTANRLELFNGVAWVGVTGTAQSEFGGGGHIYTSCKNILDLNAGATDGTYTIDPDGTGTLNEPVEVYCDMTTDGGGWTLIARNDAPTSSSHFNQNWATYKAGFGDITIANARGWIGNDHIHTLSVGGKELHVRTDTETHEYASFEVANEAGLYALTVVSTPNSNDNDQFQDNHSGMNFSTSDDDNDTHGSTNCASSNASGWWYHSCANMQFADNSQAYWRDGTGSQVNFQWIEMWVR